MSSLEKLKQRLAGVLPSAFVNEKALTAKDINEAESRIGATLPPPLRQFYEIFGGIPEIVCAFDRFAGVHEIEVINGAISFLESRQGDYRWGILLSDIASSDPPVYQEPIADRQWLSYTNSLECFIGTTVCWQALNLAERMTEARFVRKDAVKLASFLAPLQSLGIKCSGNENERAFIGERVIAMAFPKEKIAYFGGAEEGLKELERRLRISFDWL